MIGTTIGANAAIFAITIGCIPFATRMTESALQTVDKQLIKATKSFGASKTQIIIKVMLVEALPVMVSNFTIMLINMLNMSAIAGAVGAGGLGAVALTYGYQRFDYAIMYFVVCILIIFVLLIQALFLFLLAQQIQPYHCQNLDVIGHQTCHFELIVIKYRIVLLPFLSS